MIKDNKWIWGVAGLGIGLLAARWLAKRNKPGAGQVALPPPQTGQEGTEGLMAGFNPNARAWGSEGAETQPTPPPPDQVADTGSAIPDENVFEVDAGFEAGEY